MAITAEGLIAKYIDLRDKRSALKKAYEADDAVFVDAMDKMEAWFLRHMTDMGVDNVSVKGLGRATLGKDMKASCKDWKVFNAWMRDNNEMDMLERRISRTTLKAYMQEHDGAVPPAVDVIIERKVTISRSSTRGEEA